ncbi:MAG: ribonuclease [Caulobacter sp.]|nr:ribonuclease [Caulobacter sp.]
MRLALTLVAFLALTGCVAPESKTAPESTAAPDGEVNEIVVIAMAKCPTPDNLAPAPVEVGPADKVVADFTPDSYLLAFAWQPEACRSHAADTSDPSACDGGRTWTLHGLWPNSDDGNHPRYCRPSETISQRTTIDTFCMIPSARLQQHEWAAHGVCAWDSPEAYFEQAQKLSRFLVLPPFISDTMTAGALRDAFAANPGLPREAVSVAASPEGRLREVRLCHDLAFKPAACAPKALGARDDVVLTITPPN